MPLSKSPAAYTDVHQILHTALQRGGANYRLETPGKAQHWRQRAYMYRKILRQPIPPAVQERATPFDSMVLTISKSNPCMVQIHFNHEITGELYDASGARLTVDPAVLSDLADDPNPDHEEIDDLEQEALALRERLFGNAED